MIAIISAIAAIIPLVLKLIDLFKGTPEDAAAKIKSSLLEYISKLQEAVKKAEETNGDTSSLEDLLNRRRP